MKYRVAISGSYGGFNLGDEAILESILRELRATLDVDVVVFSRNSKDTELRHNVRAVPIRDMHKDAVFKELEKLDLFVLGGGGIVFDGLVEEILRDVNWARELGVPVMIYAVGVGPLNSPETKQLVVQTLADVDIITVREDEAKRILDDVGVDREIEVTADPALLLKPQTFTKKMLEKEGFDPDTRLVGFSVREPGPAAPDLNIDHYHAILANAADFMVERFDAQILFVPTEVGVNRDPQHSHAVISKMANVQRASVLKGEYSSTQIMGLVGHMEFVVAMRLHMLMETFKWVAIELLDEAGVHFLFHSFASEAIVEKRKVEGVIFETKSGPVVIRARVVLDCTGDGDVAARAGAPFEIGRQEDRLVQPMTLMFRMVEFERRAFEAYVKEHPDQWKSVHGLWDLIREASAAGELELPREDMLFFATPHEREVSVNSTRVTRVLGTDVWDLSYAEWQSRRQMRQIAAFLQRHVPGFEKSYAAQRGVNVGVRETRRIVGDYQLSVDDILSARKFPDVIARSTYPVDIHNPEGTGTLLRRLPPGESYDIPMRCLLPQNIEGLVLAGRCISGTHEAHSSYRVMPVSMATGQAAGACASLAAGSGRLPREISTSEVQAELVRQGANLGAAPSR